MRGDNVSNAQAGWIAACSMGMGGALGAIVALGVKASRTADVISALAAVGTLLAVVVAGAIAVRDILHRRAEQKVRARLAAPLLWPDLRRFLTGLHMVRRSLVSDPARAMTEGERLALNRAYGPLRDGHELVIALARDMEPRHAEQVARVVAQVKHVVRHVEQLMVHDDSYSVRTKVSKHTAIRRACDLAIHQVQPLIAHTRQFVQLTLQDHRD